MTTKNTQAGRRIEWTEDGKTYGGAIVSEEVKHHAGLDMDLTHIVIRWDDGTDDTQHTLESLVKDPRVRLLKKVPKATDGNVSHAQYHQETPFDRVPGQAIRRHQGRHP